MLQRQKRAAVATPLPDDFQVGSSDRQACWDALPPAAKSYIAQLRATHAKRADDLTSECLGFKERNSQLQAVTNFVWGHRFSDGQSPNLALLKKVHGCELKRLRDEWDNRRCRTGAPTDACSIYSLDSMLLEAILRRLNNEPPLCQNPVNRDAAAVQKRQGDRGWHARRVLAQVCRLFEALAYTIPSKAFFEMNEMQSASRAPSGFMRREFERAALAPCLNELVLALPAVHKPAPDAVMGNVLRHCDALTQLTLVLPPSAGGGFRLPQAILQALPSCARLSSVRILGDTPIHISAVCAAALTDALAAMPALSRLETNCMKFPAIFYGTHPFPSALSKCKSLREFRACRVTSPYGWEDAVRLQLQVVAIQEWRCLAGTPTRDAVISPTITCLEVSDVDVQHERQLADALSRAGNLQRLRLSVGAVSFTSPDPLADALPRMRTLRRLELGKFRGTEDIAKYFAALQQCRSLESLTFSDSLMLNCDEWAQGIANVVRACPALAVVELSDLQSMLLCGWSLDPLWRVLPECKRLRSVIVRRIELHHSNVCLLCPVLERCPALKSLTFAGCMLDEASIGMLQWVASKLDIKVEAA